MAAADYTNLVQELYISYFGRPADTTGLVNIANVLNNANAPTTLDGLLSAYNTTPAVKSLIDSFSASAESQALYGNDVIGFVSAVYQNVLNRPADFEGATFWIDAIQHGGLSMGKAALAIMAGALSNTSDQGLVDAQVVANKVAIATSFTTSIDTGLELNAYRGDAAAATVRAMLHTVTADTDTVAFQAEIDSTLADLVSPPPVVTPEPAPVVQLKLTVGQDDANGTAGNDIFTARVAQNANGEQTNQLATGDQVNGGAGTDTLNAKVQMASALNHGPASAILPETVDVEVVKFTALTVDNSATLAAQHESVTINAKEMLGLDLVGSVQSDASLVIENLTTLTDSGVYESRRDTSAVTIRMDHTGNDAALDAESDLTVLFDNDYLGAGKTNTTKAFYWLLDEKAELALLEATTPVPAGRLNAINVDGLTFDIKEADGSVTHHTLSNRDAWDTNETLHTIATHQKFIDALQAPLQAMIASGEVPAGTTLTLDPTLLDDTGLDHNLQSNSIPAIVLTLGGGLTVTPTGFAQVEDALPGFYDVYGRVDNVEDPRNLPVTSTIELEKVGRGAEGGDLTVGAMSTDFKNEWDFSDSALKEGIEKFNITVSGDKTQFSDLASLQSTNNTLAIVNIDWKAGSAANLTIGNHNTVGAVANGAGVSDDDLSSVKNNALKDVRDFTANNTTTNVKVFANLSDEVVAKYMVLTDTLDNAVEPKVQYDKNADFVYNFGAGNDTLNINLSKLNLAQSGTTNREDFSFTTTTGAGNDTIQTQIGNGAGVATDDWYINSKQNNNLTITAGDGNDIVQVFGAGHWNINLGTGDDVVYSDNSGNQLNVANDMGTGTDGLNYNSGRAVWVLNTADQASALVVDAEERNINDDGTALNDGLQTDANNVGAFLGANLTVSLRGVTTKALNITASSTSDLSLNNLIKKAIQGDVFLSKLIVAEDGPGATLVIRSLVDGGHTAADFGVNITTAPIASLSVVKLAEFNAANKTAYTTTAQVQAHVDASVAAWAAASDYDSALANDGVSVLTGTDSAAVSSNIIVDGTGNDTIVLSTSGLDVERVNLTNDGQTDTIYNITNAIITGLRQADYTAGKGDVLSFSDGTVLTTWAQVSAASALQTDGSYTLTATGTGVPVVTPPVGGTVAVAVSAANTNFDAAAANDVFAFAMGNYTYNISNFAAGDVLDFVAGNNASVSNISFTDGIVDVSFALAGQNVLVHLTGFTAAIDAQLNSVGNFNTVFGAGTII